MGNNVKKTLQGGALALALVFAQVGVSGAQESRSDGAEFNATFTLQGGFGGKKTKVNIPIDCDLLKPKGQKTLILSNNSAFGGILHGKVILRARSGICAFMASRQSVSRVCVNIA